MNIVYCKNYECPANEQLKEPIVFKMTDLYSPFEGDKCYGKCSSKSPCFEPFDISNGCFRYEGAGCFVDGEENTLPYCGRTDCLNNIQNDCNRPQILIDKSNDRWICRCYAQMKIRGHMDWFGRFLNNDGTAKGGHIDDDYANKMDKQQKTTRSYRTHMKQKTD
jgi:hypothetical protein